MGLLGGICGKWRLGFALLRRAGEEAAGEQKVVMDLEVVVDQEQGMALEQGLVVDLDRGGQAA